MKSYPGSHKVQYRYRLLIWREAIQITAASIAIGLLYSLLTDKYETITPFFNGMVIGFVCGMGIAWSELVLFRNIARKMNFIAVVALKVFTTVMIVTLTIFTVILLSRSLISGQTPLQTFYSDSFRHFLWLEDFHFIILYAFGMALLILFTKQMSRKMGPGILFNFISGKYARPFHEERIFLFMDLDHSTALAEDLGDLNYHRLLNEFFCDLAEPVAAAKGAIHHYVGDEVVITWKMDTGLASGNCLNAYFGVVEKLETLRDKYEKQFGVFPAFKAACHCGSIVIGEIGDIKSEIVFHGDVINTTARLERLCSELNEPLLISCDLLDKLPYYHHLFTTAGKFSLRGKKRTTEVFALRKETHQESVLSAGLTLQSF